MWREISGRERRHVQRMEMKMWKSRRIAALGYTVLALGFLALVTSACYEQEKNAQWEREFLLEVLYDLGNGGKDDNPVRQQKLVREARMKLKYRRLYWIECILAAAGYGGYYYFAVWRTRKYLSGTLKVRTAVCTGTKEVRRRSWHNFYVNLKTEDGEKLRELWVPWMLGEEIESETPLLLVREDEESEPRVYPARSSRGI